MSFISRLLYPRDFIQIEVNKQNTHFVDPNSGVLFIREEYKGSAKFQNLPQKLDREFFSKGYAEHNPRVRKEIDQIERQYIAWRLKNHEERTLDCQNFVFMELVDLSDWFTGTLSASEQLTKLEEAIRRLDPKKVKELMSGQGYILRVPTLFKFPRVTYTRRKTVEGIEPLRSETHDLENYADINRLRKRAHEDLILPEKPWKSMTKKSEKSFDTALKEQKACNFDILRLHNSQQGNEALKISRRDEKIIEEISKALASEQLKVKAFQGLLLIAGITTTIAAAVVKVRSE